MSTIFNIFNAYRNALTQSRSNYEELYTERARNSARFFEQDTLDFVAIDGTCIKKVFADFSTFYGGAYGAKGQLILSDDPPKILYKKRSLKKDVSIVDCEP